MTRWTKKAIGELRNQLHTFVLQHEMYYPAETVRAAVETKRLEIILHGLNGWIAMLTERAKGERETVAHYEKVGPVWTEDTRSRLGDREAEKCAASCAETAERFRKMAAENDKAVSYVRKLLQRIETEGLPPEVAAYVPKRGPRGWEPC